MTFNNEYFLDTSYFSFPVNLINKILIYEQKLCKYLFFSELNIFRREKSQLRINVIYLPIVKYMDVL